MSPSQKRSARSFGYLLHRMAALTLIGFTAVLSNLAVSKDLKAEPFTPPNIVFIMADDMGYECVAANGGSTYQTPRLDALAASGMRFTQAHSQPICTPTRVQVTTGLYNSRNYKKFGLLDPAAITFGNLLRDAGYKTAVVGKWQLKGGFEGPGKFGFDEYCLWQLTRRPNRFPNPGLEINGKERDFKQGEYGPDIVSDYACEFIERNKDQPFFLYYPMILPHWPFEPTPDSAEWNPKARRDDKSEKSGQGVNDKYFVDMVAYTDKMVGKVIDQLEKSGVRDNTLVIFTGDNGTMKGIVSVLDGKKYIGGKGQTTTNGTHVPMIANWPGVIAKEQVSNELVDFTDVLPTLLDAAKVPLPETIPFDGRSILPQLRGEPGNPREWIYCWYYRNGKVKPGAGDEFARDQRYKYYHSDRFYDLKKDFAEKHPLKVGKLTPEQASARDKLKQVVDRYHRRKKE